MVSKHSLSLICAAMILFFAGFASAMFTMTMNIYPPNFREGYNSTMDVRLINSGDETAYKGVIQIIHPLSLKMDPIIFDTLVPNVTYNRTVEVVVDKNIKPGTYPLVASLQFADSNNYPIYMIFETTFDVGKPSSTKVYGQLSQTEFPPDGTGTLTLRLKNMDEVPHSVKTRLLLPASITADKPEDVIEVEPQAEASVDYQLKNFMALQDSSFMVLATMEYDDDTHHTTTSRGMVKITAGRQAGSSLLLPAAAALVVLSIAGYAIIRMGGLENATKFLKKRKKRR